MVSYSANNALVECLARMTKAWLDHQRDALAAVVEAGASASTSGDLRSAAVSHGNGSAGCCQAGEQVQANALERSEKGA